MRRKDARQVSDGQGKNAREISTLKFNEYVKSK